MGKLLEKRERAARRSSVWLLGERLGLALGGRS
jgi:hypothetical protein